MGFLQVEDLPQVHNRFRERYVERDNRMLVMDDVYKGEWGLKSPDGQALDQSSPNLIQTAIEDTAEAAASLPTLRVAPGRVTQRAKDRASRMERIGAGYMDHAALELLSPAVILDLVAFGFSPMTVLPDAEARLPIIEHRDPRTCYPEFAIRSKGSVRRCVFSRVVEQSQLDEMYLEMIRARMREISPHDSVLTQKHTITLVDYMDHEQITTGALVSNVNYRDHEMPIILEQAPNLLKTCPVVIPSRIVLDGELRGQFDQVIGTLLAHARLMSMVIEYADQSVYSDVWVRDLLGEMPWGGGSFIELGPQGAIGRVPPAVSSLNVDRDLERLTDYLHLGGRWPKSRPGQIEQAIASGKFVEATVGMMSTVIKTIHLTMQRAWAQALRLGFATDQLYFPGEKTVSGVLRNQEFVEEYDSRKDIDLSYKVRVEYGLGIGRDSSQSAVLMMNYKQADLLSSEFVMENIDGLTDVGREMQRLDSEKLRKMMLSKLLMGIEQGTVPDAAIVDILQAREKGEDLSGLFRKYVVDPQQPPTGAPPGPTGPPLGPGGPPGLGGPPGMPGAPPGGGLMPPPPPDAQKMLARISSPAGNRGSMIGVQTSA